MLSVLAPRARAGMPDLLPPSHVVDGITPVESGCNIVLDNTTQAAYTINLSQQTPNVEFPDQCAGIGGTKIKFNNPCAWAFGRADLAAAQIGPWCKGQTRVLHWHDSADEWGIVLRGMIQAYVVSPTGVPWRSAINNVGPGGMWYFPMGWPHGLMCLTPESEGGCETYLAFRTPVVVPVDNHNLDTTIAQAPPEVSAQVLDISNSTTYEEFVLPNIYKSGLPPPNLKSPLMAMVSPEVCEPNCPAISEERVAPTAVNKSVELCVPLPGSLGGQICDVTTDQFQLATTMSQQRVELPPGAFRSQEWCANCHGLLMVLRGSVRYGLQGGISGSSNPNAAHELFLSTLGKGGIAFIPTNRAYWVMEDSGEEAAEYIIVWNVGVPQLMNLQTALRDLPPYAVVSSLNATDLSSLNAMDLPAGGSGGALLAGGPGSAGARRAGRPRQLRGAGPLQPGGDSEVSAMLQVPLAEEDGGRREGGPEDGEEVEL